MTIATQAIPKIDASKPNIGELLELMASMNVATGHLQETHEALHGEVARLQAQLAEANERLRRSRALAALGEMAAGIAHEIRNPLASIRLYAQALGEDLADQPEQGVFCEKITGAVDGLDRIVRDVLAFARDRIVRPAPQDPEVVLDRALGDCQGLLAGLDIVIEREPVDAGTCMADGVLLVQALGNVIRNAIEAMAETTGPRRLTLGAERRPERCPDGPREPRIVFSVQDTGPGIPPETVTRMFNPFFTTRASGTGLGLAIVHRIVDAHGGHVNVRNPGDGGTRIELCLPPDAGTTPSTTQHQEGDQ